jgi:hypothetical protein
LARRRRSDYWAIEWLSADMSPGVAIFVNTRECVVIGIVNDIGSVDTSDIAS